MRARAMIVAVNLALVALAPGAALAADAVRWSDVRGIIQPLSVVGSGTGAVTGGGLPWSTTSGSASINLDAGVFKFVVRGLVLAGGNSIGTRSGITVVKGTLVCDTDGSAGGGNSVLVDTDLVPLSPQGMAQFSGTVVVPAACSEPDIAFLVRTSGGAWLAYGALRRP